MNRYIRSTPMSRSDVSHTTISLFAILCIKSERNQQMNVTPKSSQNILAHAHGVQHSLVCIHLERPIGKRSGNTSEKGVPTTYFFRCPRSVRSSASWPLPVGAEQRPDPQRDPPAQIAHLIPSSFDIKAPEPMLTDIHNVACRHIYISTYIHICTHMYT